MDNLYTHSSTQTSVDEAVKKLKDEIKSKGNFDDVTVEEQLEIVDQLCEFEFGRWLLVNRGLNGYWSRYYNSKVIFGHYPKPANDLEKFMMQESPGVVSSYEQCKIQEKQFLNYLTDNMTVASIPCGFMDFLLRLDLKDKKNLKLFGIDIDPEATEGAKETAKSLNMDKICEFKVGDAWNLGIQNEFDLLVCRGLSMYAPTEEIVIQLYEQLYKSLKPNGHLFINVLIGPFDESGKMVYKMELINQKNLRRQKVVFGDVIKVRQGFLGTEAQAIKQLKQVGFRNVESYPESYHMFLTIVAQK